MRRGPVANLICPICREPFSRSVGQIRCLLPCCSGSCAAKQKGETHFARLRERFFARTRQEESCLVWTGYRDKDGYGFMSVRGKEERAHRIAYFLETKEWPPSDREVLHRCDNPPCVLFKHLFLGNQAVNMKDMIAKGRHRVPLGSKHANAKLREDQIPEIRRRLAFKEVTQTELAHELNVHPSVISRLARKEAWGHV